MQDKQKVTLYLSPELHRQLKIRAAIDSEPMSAIAERSLVFYLAHPEVVEEVEAATKGQTHRIYHCPECSGAVVMREGDLVSLKKQPGVLEEALPVDKVPVSSEAEKQGEEELIPFSLVR